MKKIAQWAIIIALITIGFLSFCVLVGEDNPNHPLTLGEWLLFKAVAAGVIYACYRIGRVLYNLGYLSAWDDYCRIVDSEDEDLD